MSMSARNSRMHRHGAARCVCRALLGVSVRLRRGAEFRRARRRRPVTHYSNGADPAATASAQGTAQHFTPGAQVAADWWHLFDSPQLDAVMTEAVANNPGLDAAQASLRAEPGQSAQRLRHFLSRHRCRCRRHARSDTAPPSSAENLPSSVFNLFTLSATVSYALDVFGGERRLVEGLRAAGRRRRAPTSRRPISHWRPISSIP